MTTVDSHEMLHELSRSIEAELAHAFHHEMHSYLTDIACCGNTLCHIFAKSGGANSPESELAKRIGDVAIRAEQLLRRERYWSSTLTHSDTVEPIPIQDIVKEVLSLYDYAIHRNGIAVRVDDVKQPLVVRGTRNQLTLSLAAIVHNAIDSYDSRKVSFAQSRRTIAIHYHKDKDDVVVHVADEGVGIAKERLASVFEPGFTTKVRKHGFGLYIAKRVISELGGRIWIDSSLGVGTRASMSLPACE